MALSFHPAIFDPLFHLSSDTDMGGPFQDTRSEVTDALLGFLSDPLDPGSFPLDAILDLPPEADCLYAEQSRSSLSAPPSMLALDPNICEQTDEHDVQRCPMQPRSWDNLFHSPPDPYALDGHQRAPEFLTEFVAPMPAFGRPAGNVAKKVGGGACLSAQSAAARERRKRISEKTQELGRLIPGGHKMNTAQMLQAAYKHVKFLQAQVSMLALMRTVEDVKIPLVAEQQLQVLLGSSNVQEKLYAEGRCLVPKKAAEAMAKDKDVKANPLVSRDLKRFMESIG